MLEAVALKDDARAVAVARKLLGLELVHRLYVCEGKLVHIVHLPKAVQLSLVAEIGSIEN